jgi:hypothetical protein
MIKNEISFKDRTLSGIFCLSGLVCFGLSFTLFHSNGRPYLFCSLLLLCMLCLVFADRRESSGVVPLADTNS